jgi:hypothetical protein
MQCHLILSFTVELSFHIEINSFFSLIDQLIIIGDTQQHGAKIDIMICVDITHYYSAHLF